MSKTPFMPLWVNDFIGDTLDLDAKEIGAYMMILMTMWGRDGTLPNDHTKLKRVARVGRDWPKVWASIEHYFTVDGDTIYNKRLLFEFTTVAAKRLVKAQSGELGGRAKALKDKEAALANATHSPQQTPSKSESEPYTDSIDTNVSLSLVPTDAQPDAISQAIELFKDAASKSGWPVPRILSKARRSALSQRLKECDGIEGWKIALEKAQASGHCCGDNDRGWVLTFDFITAQKSFAKLMEGNYDNRTHNGTANAGAVARGQTPRDIADRGARWAASREARGGAGSDA